MNIRETRRYRPLNVKETLRRSANSVGGYATTGFAGATIFEVLFDPKPGAIIANGLLTLGIGGGTYLRERRRNVVEELTQLTPEIDHVPDGLVAAVAVTHRGDKWADRVGLPIDEMDLQWQRIIEEFPQFTDRINGMKNVCRIAQTSPRPQGMKGYHDTQPFQEVTDPFAREVLEDILISRLKPSEGFWKYMNNWNKETKRMAEDLGLTNGWQSEEAKALTSLDVVEAALKGTLKIVDQQRVISSAQMLRVHHSNSTPALPQ